MRQISSISLHLIVAAILLFTVACGSQTNNTGNTGSTANNSTDTQEEQPVPAGEEESTASGHPTKTYSALNGDIDIPTAPQRIVSLVFVGELLALGVQPIGTGTAFLETGLFVEELKGVEPIGNEPSVEKILELEPDLIIMHNFIPEEVIDQLAKIAPTVVLPFNDRGPVERLHMFAELLGREAEAEQFLAQYEAKAQEAKTRLAEVINSGETVAYYEIWGKSLWVMSEANGRGVYNLYQSLGLKAPEKVQQDVVEAGKGIDISLEVLPEYAADHMFVGVYAGDGGDKRAEEIMQGTLWNSLPAAQKKQVYLVNIDEFAPSDVFALYKQLDLQVDILTGQR